MSTQKHPMISASVYTEASNDISQKRKFEIFTNDNID